VPSGYREDLAHVHDSGFGHFAENAGAVVVEELARAGFRRGRVVDLGCGSGITARLLCEAGFDVLGIDQSAPLVERARRRAPAAQFRVGSFVSEEIPPCVAVTAIGEVFNYGFDESNGAAARAAVFRRIHAALAPGGLLVFDLAGPERVPDTLPARNFFEADDWAVLVEVNGDRSGRWLTRDVTTFRRTGGLYRRDVERHRLELVDPADVVATLERFGLRVRTSPSYGPLELPKGLVAFLARKP